MKRGLASENINNFYAGFFQNGYDLLKITYLYIISCRQSFVEAKITIKITSEGREKLYVFYSVHNTWNCRVLILICHKGHT